MTLARLVQSCPQVPQLRGSVMVPQGPSGPGAVSADGDVASRFGPSAPRGASAGPGAASADVLAESLGTEASGVSSTPSSAPASVGAYLLGVAHAKDATRARAGPMIRMLVMSMYLGMFG